MRHGSLIIGLLLVTGAFTGCIGDDGSDAGELEANTEELELPGNATSRDVLLDATLTYTGCHEQLGVFAYPTQAFEGMLPEGFSLASMDPAGQTATLAVVSYSCGYENDTIAELWGMVLVNPPDEFANPDADMHLIPIGGFTSNPDVATVYEAWGFENVGGGADVDVSLVQEAPGVRVGHAIASDGDFTVHLYNTVQGQAAEFDGSEARVYAVQDGAVAGAMDVAWPEHQGVEQGEAVLQLEGEVAPLPPPASPGIAMHYWGETYDYTLSYVDLPGVGDGNATEQA